MSGNPGNKQHCTVSYNTSCNSDYNLTVQPNSDKYDVFYYFDNIAKDTTKTPNLGRLRAKITNSRGMGHCPKMVKISPEDFTVCLAISVQKLVF